VSTLTFSVIGTRRVGKTTFIRTAIDLESPSSTPFSSNKVTLNGSVYRIQFVELALDDVDFSGHRVTWPTYLNGSPVPPIDGCFCLYDVTSQISVADVPSTLSKSFFRLGPECSSSSALRCWSCLFGCLCRSESCDPQS